MTTEQVYQQIIAQLEASLGQSIPFLPRSFIRVLAKAFAAVYIQLYKYADWQFLQLFVTRATNEPTEILGRTVRPLTEWGRLVGAGGRIAATPARLSVLVEVEQDGATLPAGAQLRGVANQALYRVESATLLEEPSTVVPVVAVEPGTGGNSADNSTLEFVNPLATVGPLASVLETTATGSDAETVDDYRQRILDRFQRRPQGGAYADYAEWAGDVPGVRRVFPYTGQPGRVSIYIESATESDRVPTQAQLNAALEAIELDEDGLATRRPANAFPDVLPVTVSAFVVTVTGLDVESEAEVQADIANALAGYFAAREPFIVGLSIPPRLDRVVTSAVSSLVEQIVADAGGIVTSVAVTRQGQPFSAYVLGEGELARLQAVNYA